MRRNQFDVTFDLEGLRKQINRSSDAIKRAAAHRATEAATIMAVNLGTLYPVGPRHIRRGQWVGGGALRDSVLLTVGNWHLKLSDGTVFGVPTVKAGSVAAPHIHLWEFGTEERSDPTRLNKKTGQPARRGAVPKTPRPGRLFKPTVLRERQRMFRDIQHLLDQDKEL